MTYILKISGEIPGLGEDPRQASTQIGRKQRPLSSIT
jgi:hypothetical protein